MGAELAREAFGVLTDLFAAVRRSDKLRSHTSSAPTRGWREFSGKKSFCSDANDSQMLIASAVDESAGGKLLIAAIPSGRSGITLHDDWHNMGQRQTDSGSASFERGRVEESELLLDPGPLSTPFACLRPLIAQLTLSHMFLGIAEGAFEEARQYTLDETRPWFKSTARDIRQAPYVLNHYGDFWVALEGVRLLVERAAGLLDYKLQELGDWALNQTLPPPTFYS